MYSSFFVFPSFFHRCPQGHMIRVNGTKKSCVYTLCATRPCHRGTCVAQSPLKFTCHCPEGYRGRHCESTLAIYREDVGLSFSSLFAICICFMALLGRLNKHPQRNMQVFWYVWSLWTNFYICEAGETGNLGPGFNQFNSDQCKFWTFLWKWTCLEEIFTAVWYKEHWRQMTDFCLLELNLEIGGMEAVKGQWLLSNYCHIVLALFGKVSV